MSSPAIYPDLLIIAPHGDQVTVAAYRTGWRDVAVLWRETLPCADLDELPRCLTAVLTRRATRAKTRVALAAPAGIGGFMLYPRAAGEKCDGPWVRRQIELTLPFPAEEIAYRVSCADSMAQMFWLPLDWIKAQQTMLEKFGLVLMEILPRACLFQERVSAGDGGPRALIEGAPERAALYLLERGTVSQALQLPPAESEAGLLELAGRMLPDGTAEIPRQVALDESRSAERLLELWRDEACALRVARDAWQLWRPGVWLAMAIALCALALPAYLHWASVSMRERLVAAQKELRGLANKVDRFQEDQRALGREDGLVKAVRAIDAAPLPLDLLSRVVASLPDSAWIQNLTYTGKTLVIVGKGASDEELSQRLRKAGLVVSQTRAEPVEDAGGFRLRIQDAQEDPKKQEVK